MIFTQDVIVRLEFFTPVSLCGWVASASHGAKIITINDDNAKQLALKLAMWRHLEPLEASLFVFDCELPLFVCSQLNRHRIGCTRTQQSLRYCTMTKPKFYVDEEMKKIIDDEYIASLEKLVQKISQAKTKEEKESLNRLLPSNVIVKYRCAFNARSFAHLCEMRLSPHAQPVTQNVVKRMLDQVMQTEWRDVFSELLFSET